METAPFPVVLRVSPAERWLYNDAASAILRKAVAEHARCKGFIDPTHWEHVRSRKQLSVFRSLRARDDSGGGVFDRDPNARTAVMIGAGQIAGSLEDVMGGIYSDSTDDLFRVSTLIGHKLMDGAVLNVTERRTASNPFRFEGIKWRATKAPWGVTTNRDVLTHERTGRIVDKRGTEVAYHVLQSIDRPEWPANTLKGVKRERMYLCYLYRRDAHDPHGFTRCFFWGEVADLHPLTQRVAEYVVAGLWLNVVHSAKCAYAKQCSELIAATSRSRSNSKSEDSPTWSPGPMCRVCYKSATFLGGSLVRCVNCKQTTCRTCADRQLVFALDSKTREPKQQRICKICLTRVRSQTSSVAQTPGDDWESVPTSLGAAAAAVPSPPPSAAFVTPPRTHRISQRIKYELLEPPSHAATPSPPHSTATGASKPSVSKASHRSRDRAADAENHSSSASSGTNSDSLDIALQPEPMLDCAYQELEDMDWIDARRTEVLGEFDLDLDLDFDMAADAAPDTSSSDMSALARSASAFAWRTGEDSSDDEKQSFLDDLYSARAS